MSNNDVLKLKNPHVRDELITFHEPTHIYTIEGDSSFTSVTTWNHCHFEQFDADLIISKMRRGKNWKQSKYVNMTNEDIKLLWSDNGSTASLAGTKMHNDIEHFYNDNQVDNDSIEYQYFLKFYDDHKHMNPFRTEWVIWDSEVKIAGSVDMVFKNEDGTLSIFDWKRSKAINETNLYGKHAHTPCISHIQDCNFYHYALQLNTYKTIIERNYGFVVKDLFIVCLHPDNINSSYLKYEIPDLSREMIDLFDNRKSSIQNNSEN